MLNVSFFNKKAAEWRKFENISALELSFDHWFLYEHSGDCIVLKTSDFKLMSVNEY